jgi:hypothetical protein
VFRDAIRGATGKRRFDLPLALERPKRLIGA